jgi:transcriptional regulator with XRE-family HTH domain
MKKIPSTVKGFGSRLAYIRKLRGLTQKELGEKIGVSNRVIAYYEKETNFPPTHLLIPIAKTLEVSTDELLGLKKINTEFNVKNAALWRRLKVVAELPRNDQKQILNHIKLMAKNRGIDHKGME